MGSLATIFSLLADSRLVDESSGLTPAGSVTKQQRGTEAGVVER